ncbi:serine/threonine-protein kinase pakA-like [Clytia hemisphaerica]|uniref:Uncharacterized protein n=1 Tax=Clytia hemisphaerica TaxID=252671 RepID=A0A7M5V0Z1_9CNID
MNESFFGKYSVFCVFGSVVGCVVVPLIAQVVQQQSMECMILSAIFLTLTATRLKKGNNENPHSKLLLSKEYERKRYASQVNATNKKYKTNSNQNHHHNQNHHGNATNHQPQKQHQQQTDQEYHQKYEHLKIVEMEKKNEEKRLKKQKKREERLKRKEEELKKQKDIEEKRRRYQTKEYNTSNHHTATNRFEKYCCNMDQRSNSHSVSNKSQLRRKSRTLSQETDHQPSSHIYSTSSSTYTTRHNIPRFNNTSKRNHQSMHQPRSTSEALSISCSSNSLSTSCSSLSSISSSGSCSPPPPTSPKSVNNAPAWNKPCRFSDTDSTKSLSPRKPDFTGNDVQPELNRSWSMSGGNLIEECTGGFKGNTAAKMLPNKSHVLKSYNNGRAAARNKISTCTFDSSSLFCSSQEQGKPTTASPDEMSKGSEYSLFGSHQFGNSFLKSSII